MAVAVKERPPAQRRDTAAREKLAEAIASHAEAQTSRAAAEAAWEGLKEASLAAIGVTGDTERALKAAQQHASFGGPDHAGLWDFRVEEARTAHAVAETVATQARVAAFAAEERAAERAERVAFTAGQIERAALAVLKAEAAASALALAAEAKEALLDFATRAAALAWLERRGVIAATDPKFKELLHFFRHAGNFDVQYFPEVARVPGAAPWQLALEVLKRDADGPLPT